MCNCGNGNKGTRREALSKLAGMLIGGTALVLAELPAKALIVPPCYQIGPAPIPVQNDPCSMAYWACTNAAKKITDPALQNSARVACSAAYIGCMKAAVAALEIGHAFQVAGQWLVAHPAVVIGTILLVGAIALVVLSGGTAAPVLALAVP